MTQDTRPIAVAYERPSPDSLTKYDIGVLAVRLAGMYFLAQAFAYSSYLPGAWRYGIAGTQRWAMVSMYAGPIVAYALLGLACLAWTGKIVARLFPEFAAGAPLSPVGHDFQAVALSL